MEPLYNGNISQTFWRTANDNIKRSYGYVYDPLNRLLDAQYKIPYSSVNNSYNEHLTYDRNGNILSLKRNGRKETEQLVFMIDNLDYKYDGNRLINVTDSTDVADGFNDGNKHMHTLKNDFEYDDYGNMIVDRNKKITNITYNHLNLPKKITFENMGTIEYIYDANGQKLKKTVTEGTTNKTVDYLDGYQYEEGKINFFPTSEGYVQVILFDSGDYSYHYVYNYTDHLGNIRLKYTTHPQTGTTEILEENQYYPFGLIHDGYTGNHRIIAQDEVGPDITIKEVTLNLGDSYKYKYNQKEWQSEFNLNVYDYGARNYMPDLGRYFNMDRFSEAYIDLNPYQYTANNPVKFIDVNGDYIYIWDKNTKYRYENGEVQKQNEDGKWETHQAKEGSYLSQVSAFLGEITGGDENSFGSRFLSLFENDNINVNISENNSNRKDTKGKNITQGTTIYTSFDQKGSIRTTGGTEKLSQNYHTILFHELGHGFANNVISASVLNAAWISPDSSIGLDKPIRKSEVFASMVENMLRAEQGLNLRTHYIGGSSDDRSRLIIKSKSQSPFSRTYEPTEATRAIWNEILKSRKE